MASSHTTNLGLNKPDRQDLVSVVNDINDNMDMIDTAYGNLDTDKVNVSDIVDNLTTNDSTKPLSAAQGYALNDNIVAQAYGDWKSSPVGYTKSYKYEGENESDYDIPNSYVIVTVTKQAINRGVAIAQRWNASQMWINRLHDTWKGWTEIVLNSDITTWDAFSISVSSRINVGYSLSCRKNDTLKLCAISFSGVLNTATSVGNALFQIDPAAQPVPKKMMSFLLWNGNQSKTHSVILDPTTGIISAGEAIPAPINIAFDILFSYS